MSGSDSAIPPEALLQHAGFLRALAQGLLRDEQASEDAVQSAYLSALERPPAVVHDPRGWLARVTANLALKGQRTRRRRAAREQAAARPEAQPPASESAEREDLLRTVTEAVLGLDEPYRSTVLLRYFEELELREIAVRTGQPLATVRSRHARALERLRLRLDRAHDGERRTWSLGLVALLGGKRLGQAHAGAGTAGVVTAGALIMSSKLKLVTVLTVVLGLLAFWRGVPARSWKPGERLAGRPDPILVEPPARTDLFVEADPLETEPGPMGPGTRIEVPTTGSLQVRVTWSDGTPAGGVHVGVHPYEADIPSLEQTIATTDEQGGLRLERVRPGSLGLMVDRGGQARVRVEAGREARTEVTIPPAPDVAGRVLDARGTPLAGAEIWVTSPFSTAVGMPVAQSDGQGRFFLRSLSPGREVGARKPGFAPSAVVRPEGAVGETLALDLVLPAPGSALALDVRGPDGGPIVGARVRIGNVDPEYRPAPPLAGQAGAGFSRSRPQRCVLFTGADGSALAPSLTPGPTEVIVSGAALAPFTTTLDLVTGATRSLEVRLERGVSLQGIVRSTRGNPIEGANVRALGVASDVDPSTTSARDGSYRLQGVPAGEIQALASLPDAGREEATLRAADGERLEWNPVLEVGRVLRIRLVDGRGVGLAGWRVQVGTGGQGWNGPSRFAAQGISDEEGRVRFLNCPEEPLWLGATASSTGVLFREVELEGLQAGQDERWIEVPDEQRATGWIVGRVLGPGTPASVSLHLKRTDRGRVCSLRSDAMGAFRIGPLAPATYGLSALGDQQQGLHLGDLELVAGATLDVGTLRLGGPGRVEIVMAETPGIDRELVQLLLLTPQRRVARHLPASELGAALELQAGRYLLEAFGGSMIPERVELEVLPDETTRVELRPRPGVLVRLHFQLPLDRELPLDLDLALEFQPFDGGEPSRAEAFLSRDEGTPVEFWDFATVILPPADGGMLEISGPGGLSGRAVLGAEALQPGGRGTPATEVVLR